MFRYMGPNSTLLAGGHSLRWLPVPPLLGADPSEGQHTVKFEWVAESYGKVHPEFAKMISVTPTPTLNLVIRVQAVWKGYIFRTK